MTLNRSRWPWLIVLGICLGVFVLGIGTVVRADGTSSQPSQPLVVRGLPGQAIIFGQDNRTRIADTTQFPWSAVGQVVCDYGYQFAIGTGAMVGNRTVLTAAHVIHDQKLGRPRSIRFIPGRNGSQEPFGEVLATHHAVPNQWIQGNHDYDLGLITLEEDIGQRTGFLQLAVEPDSFYSNQAMLSAGYPSDKGDGNEMYSVSGPSTGVQGTVMLHRITTEEGQSGSPIWFSLNGKPVVVGVNVGWQEITLRSGTVINNGLATRIDDELGTFISNTLAEHGDMAQRNLPAAMPTVPATSSPVSGGGTGICGIGSGQALAVLSLSWGICFVSRRGRRMWSPWEGS